MVDTTNFNFTLTDFDKIPWHTEEHNNWHLVDALLARYVAISNVQGVWQNALIVTVGQRFIDSADDTIWEVLVAHTTSSTSTFAEERTAQSSYWQSISVDASYAGDWATGRSYTVNQFVSDSKRYGVVTVAHTSVTSYDQGVSDGNITTLVDASALISTSPVATTLSAGSSATVAFNATTGVFTFGLPTGATGDTGATGSVESVLSTRGDIIVRNSSNVTARLGVGSANTVLKSDGTDVSYATIATANVADDAITYAKIQDIGTANRVLGRASTGEVSEVQVATAMIADDAIDSQHYADGSIDTAHIATNQIDETLLKDALIADYSDVTITASDLIMYGDATDSNNTKRDTVQGILDLAGGGPTIGTEIATTSGTSKTFTGIAAGTTRIHLAFEKVGFSGTEVMLIQIGDSGGIETSGYEAGGTKVLGSASHETSALTTSFPIRRTTSANDINGIMTLLHIGNNTWISSHACGGGTSGQNDGYFGGGNKTLSGELTQIQVSGGTFDQGSLNIFTE